MNLLSSIILGLLNCGMKFMILVGLSDQSWIICFFFGFRLWLGWCLLCCSSDSFASSKVFFSFCLVLRLFGLMAPAVSVAAEWQILDNVYYRKFEVYSMQWRMDLTRHLVACAPFGGPIAAIRKWEIMQLYNESARRTLQIFNSAGVALASVVWDRPGGSIVGMSWTDDLTLVCVVQDGTVYRYNVHAEPIDPPISMGKECFQQSLADCVFWGNGMVCITESSQLFCISDFKNPKPTKLADLPILESKPVCIAAIDPQYVSEGNVEVLLGVGDYVLQVDEEEVLQLGLGIGKLQKMAISQNGTMVASFADDGRLLVTNIDFSKILLEYPCEVSISGFFL